MLHIVLYIVAVVSLVWLVELVFDYVDRR